MRVKDLGYFWFRWAGRCFWRVTCGHYQRGLENIPMKGGVIFVSNHQSYLDPMIIAMGAGIWHLHRFSFMARDTLFQNPIFAFLIDIVRAFPVKRGGADRRAWKTFEERCQEQWVLFFPEGTRSPDGSLQPASTGAGMLIHRCKGRSVVPVRIFGANRAWPKGSGFKGFFPFGVTFGKPMNLETEMSLKASREVYQAISDRTMEEIALLEPPEELRDSLYPESV